MNSQLTGGRGENLLFFFLIICKPFLAKQKTQFDPFIITVINRSAARRCDRMQVNQNVNRNQSNKK